MSELKHHLQDLAARDSKLGRAYLAALNLEQALEIAGLGDDRVTVRSIRGRVAQLQRELHLVRESLGPGPGEE